MSPVVVATEEQVKEWMREVLRECSAMAEPQPSPQERRYEYGIAGLARILDCSMTTAQKWKNSGKVPYKQLGRKVIFDVQQVLDAVSKPSHRR
jgi:hypothetical protein